jgi:hypothetical protein
MSALRDRLRKIYPNQQPGVADLIMDMIAKGTPEARTVLMDRLAVSFLEANLPDPFDQRTRQEILNGGLDPDEPSEDLPTKTDIDRERSGSHGSS